MLLKLATLSGIGETQRSSVSWREGNKHSPPSTQ